MPRWPRIATGSLTYRVLNRQGGRPPLFETSGGYAACEHLLQAAHAQTCVRIAA